MHIELTLVLEICVDGFGFFFALEDILSPVVHHCSLLIRSCLLLEKKNRLVCLSPHWCQMCKKRGECSSNLLTLFFHKTSIVSIIGDVWHFVVWSQNCHLLLVYDTLLVGNNKKAVTFWKCATLALQWTVIEKK